MLLFANLLLLLLFYSCCCYCCLVLSHSREMRLCCFSLCSVLYFSGPAHILCLTVASGWNKEQCIPEVLPLLRHRTFCNVLRNSCYNTSVRYSIWLKIFATFASTCSNLALEKFNVDNHYRNI